MYWGKNGIFSNGAGASGKKNETILQSLAIYKNQLQLKQKPKCEEQDYRTFKRKHRKIISLLLGCGKILKTKALTTTKEDLLSLVKRPYKKVRQTEWEKVSRMLKNY